jgi:hypothetical protein
MECAKGLSVSLVSVSVEKIEGNLMSLMIVVGVLILVVAAFFSGRLSRAFEPSKIIDIGPIPVLPVPPVLPVRPVPQKPMNTTGKQRNFQANPLEESKIEDVPGVGSTTRDKLVQKGIYSAVQLVVHFLMETAM